MHKSTANPSAAMQSTNNDCVASQPTTINETAAQAHTIYCVRAGCPVVVVYGVGTDWRTFSCLIDDHARVCKGGPYGLANSPPRPNALRPPRPAPARRGTHSGNRDKAIANRKQRKKEHQRKQELDEDEYTEDVKPKSVKCRGCQQTLKLDKRSRYYPGLWLKHRKKCRSIRKMEADKEQHPPAACSFDASGAESDKESNKESDGYEYQPSHIMGFSTSYVRGSWEGGEK